MEYFDKRLGIVLSEDANGQRTLVFGIYGIMSQLPQGIKLRDMVKFRQRKAHPELDDVDVSFGTNPELLVVQDSDSAIRGTGSNNCVTCRHFIANEVCPKWEANGRTFVLDQEGIKQFDVGGCVLHDMLHKLGDAKGYPSGAYEKIIEDVVENHTMVIYRDGQIISRLTPEDLGVEWQDEF